MDHLPHDQVPVSPAARIDLGRRGLGSTTLALVLLVAGALSLTGCTYYQVAPGSYSTTPVSKFDRSWNAALAAFADQGVNITHEDRGSGSMRGSKGGIDVSADIRTQADGSVRVQFDTSGDTASDPQLIDRVSRAYDRHMGR